MKKDRQRELAYKQAKINNRAPMSYKDYLKQQSKPDPLQKYFKK